MSALRDGERLLKGKKRDKPVIPTTQVERLLFSQADVRQLSRGVALRLTLGRQRSPSF